MMIPHSAAEELVRRYGGPLSHAALDPARCAFRTPAIDGLICFSQASRCAVVLGEPICAPECKAALAGAFADYCAGQGWSVLYVAATSQWQAYARELGYASIEFADLLISDPRLDPESGPQGRHLRQHLNHTRRTGVTVREFRVERDARFETRINAVYEAWLEGRQGLQMYLGRYRLFDEGLGHRWFIAERQGEVVGFLSMLPVSCFWSHSLINIVFSTPSAPLHTNELMVATALKILREEGSDSVCLGVGPLGELGRVEGYGALSEWLFRMLYRLAAKLMHQHGKTLFWEKFGITQREPLYLLFQSSRIRLNEIYALLRALNFSLTG